MKKYLLIIVAILLSACATKKTTVMESHDKKVVDETVLVDSTNVLEEETTEQLIATIVGQTNEQANVRIVEEEYDTSGHVKRRRVMDIDYTKNKNELNHIESLQTEVRKDSIYLNEQYIQQTKEESDMKSKETKKRKFFTSDIYIALGIGVVLLIAGYKIYRTFV